MSTTDKTGVEMEALLGCTSAALCVYDMCKAISHDIKITETRLISKSKEEIRWKIGHRDNESVLY